MSQIVYRMTLHYITKKKQFSTHRFFEWHAEDNKQPYYIQFKDKITPHLVVNDDGDETAANVSGKQLLTMAGLFDRQVSEEVCFFKLMIIYN